MNLQTLAFISLMDSLFKKQRNHHIHSEIQLLADYTEVSNLLYRTFRVEWIAEYWKDVTSLEDRNNLRKTLDITFHTYYRNLHNSFKIVRDFYRQLSPDIETIYVNAVPSVADLVEMYSIRSQMLQRYSSANEEEEEEKEHVIH
jgi:hypothetical protein